MTETQATSGAAGTSTNPVDPDKRDGDAAAGRSAVGRAAVPATDGSKSGPDADTPGKNEGSPGSGGGQASGGGQSTPQSGGTPGPGGGGRGGQTGPGGSTGGIGAPPKYTRAPGMQPPPDSPYTGDGGGPTAPVSAGAPPVVSASAAVPVVTAAVAVAPPVSAPPTSAVPSSAPPAIGGGRGGVATGRVAVGTPAGRTVGAARVTEAVRSARTTSSAAAARGPRRARLTVKRVDPWSVMKFSFAVALVLFIVILVATSVLYLALDAMGVFDSLNQSLGDLLSSAGGGGDSGVTITAKGVIGTAALLGAVNVVLVTALATLSAFVYNVCADLVGGIEVTLSERD